MTDRFYPLGMPSAEDAWKTTYECQTEMRSWERSAFPPGTSIHQPGARDKFGFSSPAAHAHRLAQSWTVLGEEVDNPNPRGHLAICRLPAPDDRDVFATHDIPEMAKSYRSPVAQATLTPAGRSCRRTLGSMRADRSLPNLMNQSISKLSQPNPSIEKLEDEHFSYFVPQGMAADGPDRILGRTLTKLHKKDKISFPWSGSGTGFHSVGSASWLPEQTPISNTTSYREQFNRPVSQQGQRPRGGLSRPASQGSIRPVSQGGLRPSRMSAMDMDC